MSLTTNKVFSKAGDSEENVSPVYLMQSTGTSATTVTTSPETLRQITIVADTLTKDGDMLQFETYLSGAIDGPGDKTVDIDVDGTNIYSLTTSGFNGLEQMLTVTFTRDAAGNLKCLTHSSRNSGGEDISFVDVAGIDFSADFDIVLTIQTTALAPVTSHYFYLKFGSL